MPGLKVGCQAGHVHVIAAESLHVSVILHVRPSVLAGMVYLK